MKRTASLAIKVARDRKVTSAGNARTVSAGVMFFSLMIPFVARMDGRAGATPGPGVSFPFRWSRRALDFVCSIFRRHSAAPSADKLSDLDRIAIHESGHVFVARLRNRLVHSVRVEPNPELGFAGYAMIGDGSAVYRTISEDYAQVDSISRVIDQHLPRPGESREDIEPWLRSVHENVVELLAGAAAESVMLGSANDRTARSDYQKAQRLARTICASDLSAEKFLEFAIIEAAELIEPYRDVLRALVDELVDQRKLDGDQVDRVIAATVAQRDHDREVAWKADWRGVIERASEFERDRRQ